MMCKGLFWWIDGKLISKTLAPDAPNVSHRNVWATLPSHITSGLPFDYYPRGRVELRRGRAIVFLSPYICTQEVLSETLREFGLEGISTEMKADGSHHYRCHYDEE